MLKSCPYSSRNFKNHRNTIRRQLVCVRQSARCFIGIWVLMLHYASNHGLFTISNYIIGYQQKLLWLYRTCRHLSLRETAYLTHYTDVPFIIVNYMN